MDFSHQTPTPLRRIAGIGIVLGVHLAAAVALVAHLAYKKSASITAPIETRLIEEIKIQPPPDRPPPPQPKPAAPPPSFIPPPEVQVQQQQAPDAIRLTTAIAPPDTPFKPLSPASAAPPAMAAPAAPAPPIPGFADLNACKPDYPRASLLAEEQGTVKLQFVVGADGQLMRSTVLKSSGYTDLDKATVKALSRCRFRAADRDGVKIESTFTADWVWKLD